MHLVEISHSLTLQRLHHVKQARTFKVEYELKETPEMSHFRFPGVLGLGRLLAAKNMSKY